MGLLEVYSAYILAIGIFRFYRLTKVYNVDDRIKLSRLSLHLGAFITYLASDLVMLGFLVPYTLFDTPKRYYNYLIAMTVSEYLSLASQLLMVIVLWPLTAKRELNAIKSDVGILGPEGAIWDEEMAIYQRIWLELIDEIRYGDAD